MDADDSPTIKDEEQFWQELDKVLEAPCETHEDIDDALRSYIALTTQFKKDYVETEYDFARCCYRLLNSQLFSTHQDYVRRQILYCLLQEDDIDILHISVAFLLHDGRSNESVFEMLQVEGAFPRLVDLIRDKRDDDYGLHKLLLDLMYEMSRMQNLTRQDLVTVDDAFVLYFFQLTEQLSDDADDPYHYPIIRVLLVLNEQYMCLASTPPSPPSPPPPTTNRILKLLSAHGPSYRTFGENLILLLNRSATPSAQLPILKLLYLLFTTPSTYEYFYTNDLHVLVDVIIRNLLDLDPGNVESGTEDVDGQRALRHTYLRVLCPLLKNTQLAREGSGYKRVEVRKMLHLLVNRSIAHFAPADETVLRLVVRCKQVEWVREEGDERDEEIERRLAGAGVVDGGADGVVEGSKDTDVAKKMLGMSIEEAGVSTLSVVDVSAKVAREKPSVPAPRRMRRKKTNGAVEVTPPQTDTDGVGKVEGLKVEGLKTEGLKPPPTTAGGGSNGHDVQRARSPFEDENGET